MKYFSLFVCFFLLEITVVFSQDKSYEINHTIVNSLPKNVTIVGLGDPTHQESTITKYRIDLIKKLVMEKEFKIIAIEGNMYEFYKAHQQFIKDNNVSHYEKAMYGMLNAKEMEALYAFVYEENQKGNEVKFLGFDPAFSGITFSKNIEKDLEKVTSLTAEEKKDFIKTVKKANIANFAALFRNNKKVKQKIVFYSEKILATFKPVTQNDYFFSEALKNMIFLFANDSKIKDYCDNKRDIGMALNLDFIQSQFPEEKIILFGSSTHLFKNPNAVEDSYIQNKRIPFGHKLSEKFKEDYFYIAYTSLSGTKYNYLNKNKPKTIPEASENSIEYKINQEFNAPAVYISKETTYPMNKVLESRFMGHSFLPLKLWEVMDALVLIKDVAPFEIKKR